ncbi:MAG TPA: AarF/UbiB family protein, partial [Actinokineospora sp.]|nr:AarF/UbiB family protein [Actinokineospora sp.]
SRLFQPFVPGLEVKPLLRELSDRMTEELDYRAEADNQRAFAKAFHDDARVLVPKVIASAPKVTVTEWIDGTPLAAIIKSGTAAERDHAGFLLSEFHFSSPARAGLLHSDPHPGNFMVTPDGHLGVIDFGAVARLPEGLPRPLGQMTRLSIDGRSAELLRLMRDDGFVRDGMKIDAEDVLAYLAPFAEPAAVEVFHFSRKWMQKQAERVGDLRGQDFKTGRSLNLPPQYLLIQRVTAGATGILCQLDAKVPMRAIISQWQPGFADA